MHKAVCLGTASSLVAVLLQALLATPIVAESSLAPPEPSHTFSFRTHGDAALTEWGLARFERAGLQLPPLAIAFHDIKQPCAGHFGFFRSGTPAQIDICVTWNRFSAAPKKIVLHELAHAWGQHNLTQDIRQRFLRFRGLETWWDDQTPWEEQGFEHAAEIITWALIDRELHLDTIRDTDTRTLADGYELLTSTPAPAWGRTPVAVIETASPEIESLALWAAGRFREAGLILPNIDVVFDPTGQACDGASGRFTDNGDQMQVALCTGQEGLTLTNRVAILHELGHAWLTESVPRRVQTTFLDLRGLDTWNDPDDSWNRRGFEHAAEIIAWGLMDRDVWMYRIRPNDFDSLQAGYQLLTGKQPAQRLDRHEPLSISPRLGEPRHRR